MSTKRRKPPLQNMSILLARAAAEIQPGGNIAHVEHDRWCPSLKTFSMMDCVCSPEIVIEHIGSPS